MNPSIELRTGRLHALGEVEGVLGKPMPCAVVLGCPTRRLLHGGAKSAGNLPDELDVTGGLIGQPLNVVKCEDD